MARIGHEMNVYLDADGNLVLTTQKRPDLQPLKQSSDVVIHAPLNNVIRADVTMIVSEMDLVLLPDNVRLLIRDPAAESSEPGGEGGK